MKFKMLEISKFNALLFFFFSYWNRKSKTPGNTVLCHQNRETEVPAKLCTKVRVQNAQRTIFTRTD